MCLKTAEDSYLQFYFHTSVDEVDVQFFKENLVNVFTFDGIIVIENGISAFTARILADERLVYMFFYYKKTTFLPERRFS